MISIIIRAKNEAVFLGRTLEAIRQQQIAERVEVVLVDSGSTDDTIGIAQRFGCKILTIRPEEFTFGYALNVGAAAASGEMLVALSAHAIPANDQWLAELVAPLRDPQVAAVASWQVPHPGQILEPYLIGWQALYQLGVRTQLAYRYMFSNTSAAFRAEHWRQCAFDETVRYCEDHLWAIQMQQMGYRLAHARHSVVYHSHAVPLKVRLKRIGGEVQTVLDMYLPKLPQAWERSWRELFES